MMIGTLYGAVTNTPALGAAQQTLKHFCVLRYNRSRKCKPPVQLVVAILIDYFGTTLYQSPF